MSELFIYRRDGVGTPILYLHGFLGDHRDFTPLIQQLPNPVIAPDFYGHGKSSPLPDGWDIKDAAVAIAEHMSEPLYVIGYSMGGRIALALLDHAPHLIRHLFLLSARLSPEESKEREIKHEFIESWSAKWIDLPLESALHEWYSLPLFGKLNKHPCYAELISRRSEGNPHELARVFEAMSSLKQPNYTPHVLRKQSHATLIAGELDTRYVDHYTMSAKNRLKVIPRVGHSVHLEAPKQLARVVMQQLTETQFNWTTSKEYSDILYEKMGGIAKITINRPEVRNAFRPETVREMIDALHDARHDEEIGVIILTGAGDLAFCSGGDQKKRKDAGYCDKEGMQSLNVLEFQKALRSIPKPTIAMVAGYAIGGGHVLHLICDLTVAAENAIFGQTGPRVGSFDGGFGASTLASIVGQKKAREIWYLCKQYSAQEALDMGLVNTVVPLEDLEATCIEWAEQMLRHSPIALRCMKSGFNADLDGQAGIQELAGNATMLFYMSKEAQEGHRAYIEKRAPDFSQYQRRG